MPGTRRLEFMTALVFEDKAAPEGVLELTDMQGLWLEGKLAMAPVWPYLYSLSKEPLGGKFADRAPRPDSCKPGRHGLLLGLRRGGAAEEPRRRRRVHQMGDQHRQLYAFGKEWLNPVPRASAIELISGDAGISAEDKAAIAAFAASAAAGKSMTMVPQYSQLLDMLGIMNSGVMSQGHDDRPGAGRRTARRRAEAADEAAEHATLGAAARDDGSGDAAGASPPGYALSPSRTPRRRGAR